VIYSEFLERYDSRLGPEDDGRKFTALALAGGWQWWNDQPFRDEGLCHDSETGKLHRYTTRAEKRNRLIWCIYTIGPEVEGDQFVSFPPLPNN